MIERRASRWGAVISCRSPDATGGNVRPERSRRSELMIDDVYNARILDFAGNIPRIGTLGECGCGSLRPFETLRLEGQGVARGWRATGSRISPMTWKACALGQASSSIMARNIIGASASELREVREDHARNAQGKWPGAGRSLRRSQVSRNRCATTAPATPSTLLTFDAVVDCLDQIAARRSKEDAALMSSPAAGRNWSGPWPKKTPGRLFRHRFRAALSTDIVGLHRQFLPPSADVLGICL